MTNDSTDATIAAPITCIISDVDGVMTDGRIIYDSQGTETKQFHVRDGVGIKRWLAAGNEFGILTSRTSTIVSSRAAELGIVRVEQGAGDKLPVAESMLAAAGCGFENLCYIGDDLPDLPVLQRAALAVAPSDAARDVCEAADWVLDSCGGNGAVRELIERLLRAQGRWEGSVTKAS